MVHLLFLPFAGPSVPETLGEWIIVDFQLSYLEKGTTTTSVYRRRQETNRCAL